MAGLTTGSSNKEVTVDQMDYSYINKCSNVKELEKILKALKQGREGFYPKLIDHCEKKLESLNPQSRALRKQQKILTARDLDEDDQQDLKNEMDQWTDEMNFVDSGKESKSVPNGFGDHDKLPPVRGSHILKGGKKKKLENGDSKKTNPDRIKGYDYKAWDKFNVDKECEKIDEQEDDKPSTKPMNIDLPTEIDATGFTESEREMKALREKEKGNEAFKSGDFEEALSYYCRSISLRPIPASYNNRALVYLRLERWEDAKNDCNTVLAFHGEGENLKAMLRRATACKALGSYDEAKDDLSFVLDKEQNNARAKSILADVEKLQAAEKKKLEDAQKKNEDEEKPVKPGKKMVIQEVDGGSEEEDGDSAGPDAQPEPQQTSTSPAKDDLTASEKPREEEVDVSKQKDSASIDIRAEESPPKESSPSQNIDSGFTSQNEQKGGEQPPQEKVVQTPTVEPNYPASTLKLKTKAGDFFRSGAYADACEQYTKAIGSMSGLLNGKTVDRGHEVASAVLLSNRAACWLKQGNDKACIEDCTKVLEIKTWDMKAFTRRAVAYEHMEKYALAWADYQSAYNMGRDNVLAQNGANRVAKHLREILGATWREKVPKVNHYPHHGAHVWAPPSRAVGQEPSSQKQKSDDPKGQEKKGEVKNQRSEKDSAKSADAPSPPTSSSAKKRERKTDTVTNKKTKSSKKRNKSKSKSPTKKEEKPKSPEKNQAEIDEKKLEIRRNLFEKLKADGNDFVKNGEYASAIECYTRCITVCPKEPASYTNRALCFLKLKKHVSAVNDCTEAIKLDPVNVKAYYRRAQARKAEGHYKDAERDIKKLIEIDPDNKAAKTELENLKKIAWDTARARQEINSKNEVKKNQPKKKQLVIEEVDSSSSSDEGEFILPKDEPDQKGVPKIENSPPTNISGQESKGDPKMKDSANESHLSKPTQKKGAGSQTESKKPDISASAPKDSVAEGSAGESKHDLENSKTTTNSAMKSEMKESATKDTPLRQSKESANNVEPTKSQSAQTNPKPDTSAPKEKTSFKPRSTNKSFTPYEFGHAWNAILDKEDIQSYKLILDSIAPKDLPSLISNKIDDHVIITVAKIAMEYAKSKSDYQRAFDLMYHLTKAKRFSMAAMFLTDPDRIPLNALFEILSNHDSGTYTKDELVKLQDAYCMI